MKRSTLCVLLFSCGLVSIAAGQVLQHTPSTFRGDVNYRKSSNIDGNNIRTTIFNNGYSGNPGNRPDYVNYEWPKNTGRIYIAQVDILLGGEVKATDGQTADLVEVPTGRTNPNGGSWNMEPVPGFANPQQSDIARSDKPSSWPTAAQNGWRDKRTDFFDPGWVGSWDGFFGKNIFNADQELFYVTSDDLYKRQAYIPDTTDVTRGGLGLMMDVRAFAWSHVLVNDIIFFVHDIKNDGTKTIDKASFVMFVADWVGGDDPDDFPYVDLQTATTFLTDVSRTGSAAFGSNPVGVASLKYIETPGNQVNGIDDDGDADQYPNLIAQLQSDTTRIPHFTANDFTPRSLKPGDKIVLIQPNTYDRVITKYPTGGGTVMSLGKAYVLPPAGIVLTEDTLANGYDDDLDGLIDEKQSIHLTHINEITKTTNPVRYINYLSFAVGDTVKRGFAVAGTTAEWTYRNVAPMIDESRDDGFDNDNDWDAFLDDVGMDGVRGTGDAGEKDAKPTSGAGTEFPGEPNIDKTDVHETDAIGITSAFQINDGIVSRQNWSDQALWNTLMIPGKINLLRQVGEYQMYVASGFFPLLPGQRQRMAISVAIGVSSSADADVQAVIRKQNEATKAYNADYQFAQAPLQVTLTAVPGDGKVTLYWDDIAESSFDRYINKIGGIGNDFEGYKVYRATDAAFLDAKIITDAYGVKTLLSPIAQFDKVDGIDSLHPIDINGVKFNLGMDTGLKHQFVDKNVTNGQRYFYAVTAYDFGYTAGNFAPSETPIQVNVSTDGTITHGKNVVIVRPSPAAAGYLPPQINPFTHAQGGATGTIGITIIDPSKLKNGHQYELTFEDSTYVVDAKNVLKTKNFSLRDKTENRVHLLRDTLVHQGDELPIIDGFQLSLNNEPKLALNSLKSGWNRPEVFPFDFARYSAGFVQGVENPYDYKIIIGDVGIAHSKDTTISNRKYTGKPVNFKIINTTQNRELEFLFSDNNGSDGKLSIDTLNKISPDADRVGFLEYDKSGNKILTWQFVLNLKNGTRNPAPGDTCSIVLYKPFLSVDTFDFTVNVSGVSTDQAKADLGRIRVVPNPYVAAVRWEPRNTYTSGRGPREIHFINLPARCTIRIFNAAGALIRKIEHDTQVENGTEIWDVLSDEKFEIAYGIYVYHIEAPAIGQKTGTFAIIK
ncbi:MAG TPA: hypothetical protein VK470_07570 [Bacteroidota bacterium]|nr:hypothetical protein [Bacteroidota bacterium]